MHGYARGVLALLLVFVTWTVGKSKLRKRRNHAKAASLGCLPPPELRSKNFIGNSILRDSMRATREDRGPQYVIEQMDGISADCHTLKVPILDYELLVTRDPDNARVLFSSSDFDISHTRQLSWMPLLGKGIFTSRGDVWRHSRQLLRPQFAREMISDPGLEESHLNDLWKQLPADSSTGWTGKVDLAPLFFKFTLDTATEFIFGQSTNSLQQAGQGKDISDHFNEAKVWIDKRGALAKFYWLLNSKEFKEHCNVIHRFVDQIVADRLAQPSEKATADPEKVARFNLLNELARESQDPRELRNETLHVLIAGRDTTGCLLGWVVYFLARHPEVFDKLRNTILECFGTNHADFRSLQKVSYLQWVINETLRIVTVIPMNERIALRDTTLPRGGGVDGKSKVFVPEGTQVLIPLYAMQHRQDLWGNDVEEFRPDRWETCRPGWEFLPFGAGARKCLGQQFGKQEVSYVISRICQRYDRIENMEEGDGRIRLHHAIENRSGTGVQVRLHEARSSTRTNA
ncbi:putative N-alkane-inducible cytochrome P450 [Xylariaceae sp. FL0016]|nr:putative N-alkane-inducible cytochrome P450 [Xylariaceae sp. FL0016]